MASPATLEGRLLGLFAASGAALAGELERVLTCSSEIFVVASPAGHTLDTKVSACVIKPDLL